MSKAAISEAEQTSARLDAEAQRLRDEAAYLKQVLQERRAGQVQAKNDLQDLQKHGATMRHNNDVTRKEVYIRTEQQRGLRSELDKAHKLHDSELKAVTLAMSTQERVEATWNAFDAVRKELSILGSDAAKNAALEAQGGELATTVVPPPVQPVSHESGLLGLSDLWSDSTTPVDSFSTPPEVRNALQSQAVIAALQRSLVVRAAEIREGLRQWGFARSATVRTEGHCKSLAGVQSDATNQTTSLASERDGLTSEYHACGSDLAVRKETFETLQKCHDGMLKDLHEAQQRCEATRARRDTIRKELDELRHTHIRMDSEHDEAGGDVEEKKLALEQHPEEAAKRTEAAEKLVQNTRKQVERSMDQLEQARKELASFQQAYAVLQEAQKTLDSEIETVRASTDTLREDHEKLSDDLNALAKYYVESLPPMLGAIPGLKFHGGIPTI